MINGLISSSGVLGFWGIGDVGLWQTHPQFPKTQNSSNISSNT